MKCGWDCEPSFVRSGMLSRWINLRAELPFRMLKALTTANINVLVVLLFHYPRRLVVSCVMYPSYRVILIILKILCTVIDHTIQVLQVPVYWMTHTSTCTFGNLLDLFSEGKEVVPQRLIHWRRCSYRLFIVKIILFWRSDTVQYLLVRT